MCGRVELWSKKGRVTREVVYERAQGMDILESWSAPQHIRRRLELLVSAGNFRSVSKDEVQGFEPQHRA